MLLKNIDKERIIRGVTYYNLMTRLEAYRRGNRITKAEMSRIMGCSSREQYIQWVKRDSLPKAYHDTALRILGNSGELTRAQIELIEKIEALPEKERKLVVSMIDQMLAGQSD